ncbi:MAG: hypothetical protein JW861_02885 [Bacteroidales bacterium]|nr:hypothetical protein [Bacteroidales bacterium]
MKKIALGLTALIATVMVSAQPPQAFKYQAVARDVSGVLLSNHNVSFRIGILAGDINGPVVYQETFSATTNDYGLVNLEIGNGVPVSGSFSSIDWSSGDYFLKTEMDETGGSNYITMGTTQLLSVPFALYSGSSGDDGDWHFNGNKIYYNGGNVGIGTSDPLQYGAAGITLDVNGGVTSRYGFGLIRNDNWGAYNLSGNGGGSMWAMGVLGDAGVFHIGLNLNPVISIKSNGKVGIRDDNPEFDLVVNSEISQQPAISWQQGGNEKGRLCIQEGWGKLILFGGSYSVSLAAHGNSYINNSGNLGIGLTNPTAKLEVNGTVKATSFTGDGSGLTGIAGDNLGNHQASQNIRMNNHWLSGDGTNEGIFIQNNGMVGVGTSDPGATLEVDGNFATTKGFIDLTGYTSYTLFPEKSFYYITGDPAGTTLTIADGVAEGQMLTIVVSQNFPVTIPDSGNARLSGTWTGISDGLIMLIWGHAWIEVSRSVN